MHDLESFADRILDELMATHPMRRRPEIEWRNLRVTAGLACYHEHQIRLSRIVLRDEESVRATLIHEYAHLLAVERFGRAGAGHGPHWKSVMRELGAAPQVRHSYAVQRNQKRQEVAYRCDRCGTLLTRSRKLPARRPYVHNGCGGLVRLAYQKALPAD